MKPFLLLVGLGALCCVARADDAEVSYGGSPSALKGTGQVTMQSEVVLLDIGPSSVKADCQFVFKNTGKATTIRMGFPDGDSQEEDEQDKKAPPQSSFTSFTSFVDGSAVPTSLVRGADWSYHVKTVSFPANGIRRVREVYTVPLGGNVSGNETAYYVLETGASWRGPIGRMEVIARFRRSKRAHPTTGNTFQDVRAFSHKSLGENSSYETKWARPNEEAVLYDGPGAPQKEHNVLRWVKTNIRPTSKDNIFLVFSGHRRK